MKRVFILPFLFLLSLTLQAQDKIYKSDNSVIEAKVLEVTSTFVKYKKASNPDGPVYTLYKDEIVMIIYENGEHEIFKEPASEPTTSETAYFEEGSSEVFHDKTIMGMDLFQFYYRNVSFFVESIQSKIFGMRISFYFNFNKDVDRPHFPIQFGVSAFPKFYMYNNDYVHVFIGPSFHHGVSRNDYLTIIDYDYNGYTTIPIYGVETIWNWHNLFLVEPGVSVNPVKNLDITFSFGVGFVSSINDLGDKVNDDGIQSSFDYAWKIGMTIGGKW